MTRLPLPRRRTRRCPHCGGRKCGWRTSTPRVCDVYGPEVQMVDLPHKWWREGLRGGGWSDWWCRYCLVSRLDVPDNEHCCTRSHRSDEPEWPDFCRATRLTNVGINAPFRDRCRNPRPLGQDFCAYHQPARAEVRELRKRVVQQAARIAKLESKLFNHWTGEE